MPRRSRQITYALSAPAAVDRAAARLDENIATARLRRRLPQAELAKKVGITRHTGVEQGKLGTGIGAYVAVLWALGMEDGISAVAAPDRDLEGITLEAARRGTRARDLNDDF